MSYNIMNKAILNVAGISVFAAMFCMGCYDLGLEPTVKPSAVETFKDSRDGHVYKKVKIGTQTWMAENLRFAADGSVCYDDYWAAYDSAKNCEVYGRLYDWYTAMDGESGSSAEPSGVKGVCPADWHLPSYAEWTTLIDYVGEHSGTKLKSHEFHDYSELHTPDGADMYNFSALPGGIGWHRDGSNHFGRIGNDGYWWTATELDSDSEKIWVNMLDDTHTTVIRYNIDKHGYFLSVRCVHDY